MSTKEIKVTLPEHLAEWLEQFSEALAMSPSQLIANIIYHYYEAWRVGREWEIRMELLKKRRGVKNDSLVLRTK